MSPASDFSKVLLPAPLGPMRAVTNAPTAFRRKVDLLQRPHFLILHAEIHDFEPMMLRMLATSAPADVLLGMDMGNGGTHFHSKVMTSSKLPTEDQRVSLREARLSGSSSTVIEVSGVPSAQVALKNTSHTILHRGQGGLHFNGRACNLSNQFLVSNLHAQRRRLVRITRSRSKVFTLCESSTFAVAVFA